MLQLFHYSFWFCSKQFSWHPFGTNTEAYAYHIYFLSISGATDFLLFGTYEFSYVGKSKEKPSDSCYTDVSTFLLVSKTIGHVCI